MSSTVFSKTGVALLLGASCMLLWTSGALAGGGPCTGYAGGGSFGIHNGVPMSAARPVGARAANLTVTPRANAAWSAGRTFINPHLAYRVNNPATNVQFSTPPAMDEPPRTPYWNASAAVDTPVEPVTGAGSYINPGSAFTAPEATTAAPNVPATTPAVNPLVIPRVATRVPNYWATAPANWATRPGATSSNPSRYYSSYWPWSRFGISPGYYSYDFGYSYPYGLSYNYTVPFVTDYGYSYPYATGDDVSNSPYDMPPYTADFAVSRPLTETVTSGDVQPPTVIGATTGADYLGQATAAFRNGDFGSAVRLAGHAAIDQPRNPNAHLISSLGLLALGQYRAAATEAHAVASLGDVPNWPTVYHLYGSSEPYTAQLRTLERFVRQNPTSADGRFLLGFQYLMTGHPDAANSQLLLALEMTPRDRVAADLLTRAGGIIPAEVARELARPPAVEGGTALDREPRTARRPAVTPLPERQR